MSNSERTNFYRLSIQGFNSSVYADTVIADLDRNNTLMFASMILTDTMAKDANRVFGKTASIYMEAIRKYLNNAGEKYNVIKKKIHNSNYNHVIITRKDKTERINDRNELYDFVTYVKVTGNIVDNRDENMQLFYNGLYDKLYEMTSIPLLVEWMPVLAHKMREHSFLRPLRVETVHSPANILAYRVMISKEQLTTLVTDMVKEGEVNINGTNEKSDIIDCVNGLDSYLNIFGDTLAERIQNSFVPKFDPESNAFDQYVNNYDDSCFYQGKELFKAQKAVIQSCVNNLNQNDVTFVIGEMGCGKTLLGSGMTYSHYGKKTGMTNIVMCPSHLVFKWKREIEQLVPNSRAYIVKTISDLIALEPKIKAKMKLEHTYIIMSKENAKFSYELRPAVKWSVHHNTFVCPECGQPLIKRIKIGSGRNATVINEKFNMTDMLKQQSHNSVCMNKKTIIDAAGKRREVPCEAKLWGPLNKNEHNPEWAKLGATGWVMFRHIDDLYMLLNNKEALSKKEGELFAKVVDMKNAMDDGEELKGLKAPRKYSIAKYIRERYKGYIDYFICDELHLFKGNSKQGQAMADIATASKKFIGLTGTLLNGYADGLFYILYRTLPKMMKKAGYTYQSEAEFMRDYGVIRKDSKYGFRNGRTQDKISGTEKRLPGVSPLVFTKFLLENSVFISLADMDGGLPDYKEIPVEIEMDQELKDAYSNIETQLRNQVGGYREGGMKAMGAMLQTLSVYPDMPYNQPPVLHPDTNEIIAVPPTLEKGLRNKEEKLLELVQDKLAKGEKVLVYYEWTNKTDIAEKLTDMFKDNGIRSAVLTSSVSAETREDWVADKLSKGLDVLMCNPKLVETGLDLLDFTTIIFYQVGYNIFTMRQASRRSWRLSQTKDIEVYFMYYKDTIQAQALSLMATKLQASMAIEGKFSEEGLRAMSNNEDLLTQIANSVVEGIKDTVQVQSFVSTERKERERDTTRIRISMKSLLINRPHVAALSFMKNNSAIKQKTLSTNKTLFKDLLSSNMHIGNLL